jgi:hypothetical protein
LAYEDSQHHPLALLDPFYAISNLLLFLLPNRNRLGGCSYLLSFAKCFAYTRHLASPATRPDHHMVQREEEALKQAGLVQKIWLRDVPALKLQ